MDAIERSDYPSWELGVQLFDDEFADRFDFDVLDPTKIIPEEVVPVRRVGRLVLDQVVDNFFAETVQVAFCTQNVVPGIDFTNDPLLQGRNFSYLDSQARQFYLSQTEVGRRHIVYAFAFELSKCQNPEIRSRMVAGLLNVDDGLARQVADGLGTEVLPDPLPAARAPKTDLPPSRALCILRNGPASFAGRKIGVLVTNGTEAYVLSAVEAAAEQEHLFVEYIAPVVGGVAASDGSAVKVSQQLGGGPSVLYDAVVLAPSAREADNLARSPAARDFVADAHAHCKFVGYTSSAGPVLTSAGVDDQLDDGFMNLTAANAPEFVARCGQLRHWARATSALV